MQIEHYVVDIDMIFHFKAAQNLVAEHYVRYFDMIFHYNEGRNLVAVNYRHEIFHTILQFKEIDLKLSPLYPFVA